MRLLFCDDAGRVRFAEQDPPAVIASTATGADQKNITVNLGLLLVGGHYCADIVPLTSPDVLVKGLTACNVTVAAEARSSGPVLVLSVLAEVPGPFEACFALQSLGQQEDQVVQVTATVVPRQKGTPALREGVRCLGFLAATDVE